MPNTEQIHNQVQEIRSVVINHQLSLDIYVPGSADYENKRYATIYVMDGKYYFYNAIAFQKSMRQENVIVSPEFIVVGININEPADNPSFRRDLLGPDADKMIALLEDEIIPYVDENYPSQQSRMFFGWQFAAGFGLELFSKRPDLFEGYFLASSPTFTEERLNRASETLKNNNNLNNHFYLSLGEKENHATDNYNELDKLLKQYASQGIKSKYKQSSDYNHHTTPLDSFTHGLAWYFSDYPDITFHSIEDIHTFGGISAVKAYYSHRGKRYKISSAVSSQTKFSVFRHAAQANEWELFQQFEQALGEHTLSSDASGYWYDFFGQFYLKNDAFTKAEKLYQQAVKTYSTSNILWANLAKTYEKQGNLKPAIDAYQEALKNSESQEPNHSKYQMKIEVLRKSIIH